MRNVGLTAFLVGYGTSVIAAAVGSVIATVDNNRDGASCASAAPYSFIPLAGAFVTAARYPHYQIATPGGPILDCNGARTAVNALVVVSELLQIGGAATIIVGIAWPKKPTSTGRIFVSPGTAMAPLGISVTLTGL